jgi:septal ring factor EnvC (AmiA/AmiB activator)
MGLKALQIFAASGCIIFSSLQLITAAEYNYVDDKKKQAEIFRDDIDELEQYVSLSREQLRIFYDSLQICNRELNYLGELLVNVDYKNLTPEDKILLQTLEIEDINDRIGELKDKFQQKIIWLYKFGPNYRDKLLLSSGSLNEFYIRLEYLDKMSELRKSDYNRIREKQSLLEEKKSILNLGYFQRRKFIRSKTAAQKTLLDNKLQLEKDISLLEDAIIDYNRQIERKKSMLRKTEDLILNTGSGFQAHLNNTPGYNRASFSSLKGKLIVPVLSTDIVTDYGLYINPKYKDAVFNRYVEVSVARGSEVYCVADGIVSEVTLLPSLGQVVLIDHGEGFTTVYAILENVNVLPGQKVTAGQVIANTSENLDGQLFHFELWQNDSPLDPKSWIKIS